MKKCIFNSKTSLSKNKSLVEDYVSLIISLIYD